MIFSRREKAYATWKLKVEVVFDLSRRSMHRRYVKG